MAVSGCRIRDIGLLQCAWGPLGLWRTLHNPDHGAVMEQLQAIGNNFKGAAVGFL